MAGIGFGPALGGLLADAYGLSSPFLVVAAGALLTAVYGWWRLPETGEDPAGPGATATSGGARLSLLASRNILAVGFVTFALFSIRAGVRQALVPLQLNRAFGLQVDELGLLFTALGVIGMVLIWPAGYTANRFGAKNVIVPTALLIAVGMGLVAVTDTLTVSSSVSWCPPSAPA